MSNSILFDNVAWPQYTSKEADQIKKKLLSNKTNYLFGSEGILFEKEFSKKVDCKYGVAVSNGTVALELALRSLHLNKDDEVLVTCRSFIASASSILNVGLKVVFSDVDKYSHNISLETIKKGITKNTKVILCVHFAGLPCDMKDISKYSKKRNIKIIEDCSQAHGAQINNQSVGSFGDVAAWSFCQDKIISTGGEGGMVTTNNKKIYDYIWSYKDHGKNKKKYFKKYNNTHFKYIHEFQGSNYRLTEIQSLLGRIHVRKLDDYSKQRNKIAKYIITKLKNFEIFNFQNVPNKFKHAYYKLYISINSELLNKKFDNKFILDYLKIHKIPSGQGTCSEIYLEKTFSNIKMKKNILYNNAKYLGKYSFAINITNLYTKRHCDYIISKISNLAIKISKQ
ncbi:MAG: DegT/DnrJ/EryC1/StrS family aminotransferase [Alphaproteobacteria bacterium]